MPGLGDGAVFSDRPLILFLNVAKYKGGRWYSASFMVMNPDDGKAPTKDEAAAVMKDVTAKL